MSFSTTSGTLATRFSPAKVSRGTPINWDIDWGGILACCSAFFLTSVNPGEPAEAALGELEGALHEERERRGGNRAREQRHVVVQGKPRGDALAVAARADESGSRGGADIDHGRSLDAGEDRRRCERQLDQPQALAGPQPERERRLPHATAKRQEPGAGVADNGQERIEKEGDERRQDAD